MPGVGETPRRMEKPCKEQVDRGGFGGEADRLQLAYQMKQEAGEFSFREFPSAGEGQGGHQLSDQAHSGSATFRDFGFRT